MADLAADATLASELAFDTFIGAVGLVVTAMENQKENSWPIGIRLLTQVRHSCSIRQSWRHAQDSRGTARKSQQ